MQITVYSGDEWTPEPDYHVEYCDMLVDHMGRGLSFESFAGAIRTSEETILGWLNWHPDFARARKHGEAAKRLIFEQAGAIGMMGKVKDFKPHVWAMEMRNHFGWDVNMTSKMPVITTNVNPQGDGILDSLNKSAALWAGDNQTLNFIDLDGEEEDDGEASDADSDTD